MTQRALGVAAGLDEAVASARMNRYEVGVHEPDYGTALRVAQKLDVPVAYLYCDSDSLADLLLALYRAEPSVLSEVRRVLDRTQPR